MYTIEDLERARAELKSWSDRFANYSGNNPNKYQADIKAARQKVRMIEDDLKARGVLPLTEQEQLEKELDEAFPNAQSRQIVEYRGKRYQRKFFPLEKSRSGKTVTAWGKKWVEVPDES